MLVGSLLRRSRVVFLMKGLTVRVCFAALAFCIISSGLAYSAEAAAVFAEKLLNTGVTLSNRTDYLEALDVLSEAQDILESSGLNESALYADVLYTLAQTKIKARIHQNFPAFYVKSALKEVQTSNRLKEKIRGILPQKLAEGYYLEGYIHKKFFMRTNMALACFTKAVNFDPGFVAAKRELSELITGEDQK
jgi:tetratricopeptide (TPR) repeat protein